MHSVPWLGNVHCSVGIDSVKTSLTFPAFLLLQKYQETLFCDEEKPFLPVIPHSLSLCVHIHQPLVSSSAPSVRPTYLCRNTNSFCQLPLSGSMWFSVCLQQHLLIITVFIFLNNEVCESIFVYLSIFLVTCLYSLFTCC